MPHSWRMPVLTSPEIAMKFKEKWLMLHPEDQDNASGAVTLDDSLTSLQWLQDFSILSANLERPFNSSFHLQFHQAHQKILQSSDGPTSPPAGDTAATGMPPSLGKPTSAATSSSSTCLQTLPSVPLSNPEEIDYKNNPHIKPPYSYATLICMAMQASKKTKITLSAIYSWITENFCYYRHADPSWQNSIRHNLSLNKCFMKVPRQKDEPGKGGFWQIDPQYADMFVNGVFKRRRMPATHFNSMRQNKMVPVPELSYSTAVNTNNEQPASGYAPNPHHHHSHHYHQDQSFSLPAPQPMVTKHKQPKPKCNMKVAGSSKLPLLALEDRDAESLKGDFDWALVFDDVLNSNDSNFEDFDVNVALNSLGTDIDLTVQGRHITASNRCCLSTLDHHCTENNLQGSQFEDLPFFNDPLKHPWEEVKEDATDHLCNFDPSLNFCEGFLNDIPQWERVDAFM